MLKFGQTNRQPRPLTLSEAEGPKRLGESPDFPATAVTGLSQTPVLDFLMVLRVYWWRQGAVMEQARTRYGYEDLLADLEQAGLPRALEFLTNGTMFVGEAARTLGVVENTVKNWIKAGVFPGAYQTKGGHWRLPAQRVLELRDAALAAEEMNRTGKIVFVPFEGDPYADRPNA